MITHILTIAALLLGSKVHATATIRVSTKLACPACDATLSLNGPKTLIGEGGLSQNGLIGTNGIS